MIGLTEVCIYTLKHKIFDHPSSLAAPSEAETKSVENLRNTPNEELMDFDTKVDQ